MSWQLTPTLALELPKGTVQAGQAKLPRVMEDLLYAIAIVSLQPGQSGEQLQYCSFSVRCFQFTLVIE